MLDSEFNTVGRKCWRDWLQRRRPLLLLIALLMFGWLVFSEIAEARRPIVQQDRLTPIQRAIERQRQRLSSTEAEERRDALMQLANLKRPDASRAAAASLQDKSPAVRVAAAHAVFSLPGAEAVRLLIPLLQDKQEFVRREAAFALGQARDRSATLPLTDVLLHDKKSARTAAAVALGQIGDEAAVPTLSQIVSGQDSRKKKTKNSEEEFVVRSAVRSLGQIRSRAAVATLISALQDETNSIETRREAATALGSIGDPTALPALQSTFQSNADPYLSEAARLALRRIERMQ